MRNHGSFPTKSFLDDDNAGQAMTIMVSCGSLTVTLTFGSSPKIAYLLGTYVKLQPEWRTNKYRACFGA